MPLRLRKWLVRGVVFGIISVCVAGSMLYQQFTNPAAVRTQILAKLKAIFPGAESAIGSARLRILGGIQVDDLHLVRRDDNDSVDVAHVPTAILYHDKEKLLDVELVFRKAEFLKPRFHVTRRPDGTWNIQGITGELHPDIVIPSLIVRE